MQHRMKCKKEHKIDYVKDICNGVENGAMIVAVVNRRMLIWIYL